MTCATPSNCQPCSKCGTTAPPVMPRCDVVLPDGSYTNATVVVDNGCIVDVQPGTPLLYQPDACCAAPGSGGGDDGLDGEQGPPGQAATIQPGTVTSLPFGSTPTVTNSGSSSNAIFDFGIPRGEPGEDGETPTGATSDLGGIELEDGAIKDPLPVAWPPVLSITWTAPTVVGVVASQAKNNVDGSYVLTYDISGYATDVQSQLDALDAGLDDHETRIDALESNTSDPQLNSYNVAGLPAIAGAGTLIFVTNESGGAVPAFSDGTNWRRVTDRAVVS